MVDFENYANQVLAKFGYKKTPNRSLILRALAETQKPLSAYDIQNVFEGEAKLNVVTVYRTLELLESLGLIHKVVATDGYYPCAFKDADLSDTDHGFLVCRSCEHVEEFIDEHHCKGSEKTLAQAKGFSCEKHIQEVVGLCASCQR